MNIDPHDASIIPSPQPQVMLSPWTWPDGANIPGFRASLYEDVEYRHKYPNPECYKSTPLGNKLRQLNRSMKEVIEAKSVYDTFDSDELDLSSCNKGWVVINCVKNTSLKTVTIKDISQEEPDRQTPPNRHKHPKRQRRRCVSFADDVGMPLTTECLFDDINGLLSDSSTVFPSNDSESEVSDCASSNDSTDPSLFRRMDSREVSRRRLERKNKGRLTCYFDDPCKDFVKFTENLQRELVSLENIRVERNQNVYGTIKAVRLGISRDVFLIVSYDNWGSKVEIPCIPAVPKNCDDVIQWQLKSVGIDTYAYEFDVPSDAEYVNMGVKYTVDDKEHWDTNYGRMYNLERIRPSQ